ncbi:GvpL/GvpF family gas vesicle protein [Streptosporangium sp. NPDC049304]|uniref:GvpL/GvpF family gas vesicle protein n=1 Tax=Streptosporangium sp. NPDC049304 TaxID=3154830 RepID=UPI003440F9AC
MPGSTGKRGTVRSDSPKTDTRRTARHDTGRTDQSATARSEEKPSKEHGAPGGTAGTYVYGIIPSDVELTPGTRGVGDPPNVVELVRHKEIAALVSDVFTDRPLGRPDDLMAHEHLLDATATQVPVLPLRFGAVVTDAQAVVDELLAPYYDEFLATLSELEGRAEYVVKGRYVERAILREVLDEDPEIARLREAIHGRPEEATWDTRMRLGELINMSIAAKREADTDALVEAFDPLCVSALVREPTHERDAVHVALLADTDRGREIEEAVDEFGTRWAGRVELRLLGPLAPYDFVKT